MLLKCGLGGMGLCIMSEFIWKEGPEVVDEKSDAFDIEMLSVSWRLDCIVYI